VVISGSIEAGALNEPKHGLVNFLGGMLMRGTKNRDFADIHEALEAVGANLRITGSRHSVSFGGKCLDEDLPLLFDILNDSLRNPAFPEQQVERMRGELLTYLKMREQNTRYMANRRFIELAYPESHPYHPNITGTVESIASIGIDDMLAYHEAQFGPAGMIVVVVGNIEADDAIQLVEHTFGDWENPSQELLPEVPSVDGLTDIHYDHVKMPGKSQADMVLGVPGPARKAPDYAHARLANHILGVFGMYGRLGKSVREEQGLAYYSYSQMQGGLGPGSWRVLAGVDPANVKQAVDSIRAEIERLVDTLPTEDDLADSKANLTGSLPLQLESNEGVAMTIYNIERYDLGLDYIHEYNDMMQAITAEQVQAVAHKYWGKDAFALAVAGPDIDGEVI
jgi:zinc protease